MRSLIAALLVAFATPLFAEESVDYVRQIKPLLQQRCYACHGAVQQKSGLRLDTAAALRKGGDGGEIIEPGAKDDGPLLDRLTGKVSPQMPPKGEGTPLTAEEIELVRRWIAQGATGPADERPQTDPRDWWSYRTPVKAAVPAAPANAAAIRNPIDSFLAADHARRGLVARAEAPRETWLRRVTLDLTGVPPTRSELQAFLADASPEAHERVVDGLLSRPQYGQRWGRHWMDVWRYSDWYGSRGGNEIRYSQRNIWRWRDWIVDSLNADKPYDRMVQEMLAGDEVAPLDPDTLRATGFIGRNWYKFDRNVWMFDLVEHTAQAFLGLTLKCCRCHDHKYDPISHEDYYRFRAFFEPHDLRTDPLTANAPTEKDATLGMVLKDGVPRAFDKQLDVPTYVFQRGDNRYPDESRKMPPGVPASLGGAALDVQTVALPLEAWYPALKPILADGLVAQAESAVEKTTQDLAAARTKAEATSRSAQDLAVRIEKGEQPPSEASIVFRDDFAMARADAWKAFSGKWTYENGRLVQHTLGNFCTYVSTTNHPRDFRARWTYRALPGGRLNSIGFSFDYQDQNNSQDVYTHVNAGSQGIQAFHRNGAQVYPPAGIVKTTVLQVEQPATVEIVVRGSQLTIWLNGVLQLDYVMPIPRHEGKFALWAHEGAAEFHELEIRELTPTLADLKREQLLAVDSVVLTERKLATSRAEVLSVKARIAAERARYSGVPDAEAQALILSASRAEREVAVAKADESVLLAEQQLAQVRSAQPAETQTPAPAVVDAEKKLADAQQALAAARAAAAAPDGKYASLGEQFPATSTGRRTALARWITSRENPRTARIAVNHIWLRHFGQALVPTVENFGLNGAQPTHPELLDWLAVELMDNGWRMKTIHKWIVLSAAYRRVSTDAGPQDPNRAIDPENRALWRMNSRRMEAEVVRDSLLATAGALDDRLGGPEIPEGDGQTNPRRSMYFRLTPNEKMKFLELFDSVDPNACYRRRESVVPQQALTLMNSALALDQSRGLAEQLTQQAATGFDAAGDLAFVAAAFESVLSRNPTPVEQQACLKFLKDNQMVLAGPQNAYPAGSTPKRAAAAQPAQRARENLIHVLFSHNDFVTIR